MRFNYDKKFFVEDLKPGDSFFIKEDWSYDQGLIRSFEFVFIVFIQKRDNLYFNVGILTVNMIVDDINGISEKLYFDTVMYLRDSIFLKPRKFVMIEKL